MIKKTLYLGLPILLLLLFIYYYLGGFNKTEIKLVDTGDYVVAGYPYHGRYQEDELQELFFQVRGVAEDGLLNGVVTVLNYDVGLQAGDSISQLIGIQIDEVPMQIPENMQIDTVKAKQAVRVVIKAHPHTMPRPEKIQEEIIEFGRQESLDLRNFTIEQYVGKEEIWVDVPIE